MTIDERRLAEITRELCEHIGALHDAAASAEKRAEDAERKLTTLVAAWERESGQGIEVLAGSADIGAVAERHDREVRAKELRRLAEQALSVDNDCPFYGEEAHDANRWLRDEADRIERGEV